MPILSHKPEEIDAGLPRGTRVVIECDLCRCPFERKAKLIKGDRKRGRLENRFFCSKECRDKGRQIHPRQLDCKECHTPFIPEGKQSFCSQKCAAHYNNRLRHPDSYKSSTTFRLRSYMEFETHEMWSKDDIKVVRIRPKRKARVYGNRMSLKCEGCGKEVMRTTAQLEKTKHGKPYCSKGCRMRHYNANILTRTSNQRSNAEDSLRDLIAADYPNLVIRMNDRDTLPSRLELDLYLPQVRLAIELNGPVHYFPIYGEQRLNLVQSKDAIKHKETQELGIGLLVLDISRLQTKKRTQAFLSEQYFSVIKPLIMGAAVGVPPTIG